MADPLSTLSAMMEEVPPPGEELSSSKEANFNSSSLSRPVSLRRESEPEGEAGLDVDDQPTTRSDHHRAPRAVRFESRLAKWRRALGAQNARASYATAEKRAGGPESPKIQAAAEAVLEALLEKGCRLASGEALSVGGAVGFASESAACRNVVAKIVAVWSQAFRASGDAATEFFAAYGAVHVASLAVCCVAPPDTGLFPWQDPEDSSVDEDAIADRALFVEAEAFELLRAFATKFQSLVDGSLHDAISKRGRNMLKQVDPPLFERLKGDQGTNDILTQAEKLWLSSLWACEANLSDALSVWDATLEKIIPNNNNEKKERQPKQDASSFEDDDDIVDVDLNDDDAPVVAKEPTVTEKDLPKQQEFLGSVLCASLLRRRDDLLTDTNLPVDLASSSSTTRRLVDEPASLALEASRLQDPRSREESSEDGATVDVVDFGAGPLGILLTRKRRGLVVSNFSSEERRAASTPRIADVLLAVNGRALPNDASLADAVSILKSVGRPVLVAFRRATDADRASDAADEHRRRQQQQQQQLAAQQAQAAQGSPPTPQRHFRIGTAGPPPSSSASQLFTPPSPPPTYTPPTTRPPLEHIYQAPALKPLEAPPTAPDGYVIDLLPGEVVFASLSCAAVDASLSEPSRYGGLASRTLPGELYCTSYRLVFHVVGLDRSSPYRPSWASITSGDDWHFPVRCLDRCDFAPPANQARSLNFAGKDGQRRHFAVPERLSDDGTQLVRAVTSLAFSRAPDAFARAHKSALEAPPGTWPPMNEDEKDDDDDDATVTSTMTTHRRKVNGRRSTPEEDRQRRAEALPQMASYTLASDYEQTTLRPYLRAEYPRRGLRLVRQRDNLSLCETYPPELVVPSAISDLELKKVAAYRSKGRLPVVIWTSPDPDNGATMSRSAQPKPGVQNKRSSDDERYLDELRRLCAARRLVIVDARSKVATQGNRVMGMGTELTRYYEGIELLYGNIANIHAARDALASVQSICRAGGSPVVSSSALSSFFDGDSSALLSGGGGGTSASSGALSAMGQTTSGSSRSPFHPVSTAEGSTWLAKLDGTTWLKQVHSILAAAVRTVELLYYERTAVLVHCSDGYVSSSTLPRSRLTTYVGGTARRRSPSWRS